ncbi:hypothetical protein ABVT39_008232 [Epinephelus coioides]
MFSWGEDSQQGFRLRDGSHISADDGVHLLNLGHHITDLSVGHNVLAYINSNGDAFIIHTNQRTDGTRFRGRQKCVKCKQKIKAVSCGDDLVTLLSETGKVLCVDTTHTNIPRPVEALCNIVVSQVACGSQHSVALTKDGQVYTWGQDSRGQLGLGRRKLGASSPQHLRSLSAIPLVQIAAGGEQSFALSVSGGVFGWGRNDCGQLGLGDTTDRNTPTPVHCLNMKKSIHISCGKDHTAVLTKTGAVFTFGSGQYGQLGHNSFSDELRPQLVADFGGAKVTRIACGRHHTLVLTDSKKVYSFGCGEQGQLGHGEESHQSVLLPVQLPQDTTDDAQIRNIFAGGNCSFATCTSNEDIHEKSNTDSVNNVTQHCLDNMIDKWISECDLKSWKKIKHKDKHFQTSPKYSGLNLKLAHLAFEKLVKKDTVFAEVEAAVLHLLPSLDKKPVSVEGLRIFLLLNELLHVTQRHKRHQTSTKLAEAVAAAVVNLSADSLQVIGDWWSSLSPSTMVRHVKVWKQALSVILSSKCVPRNSGVRNLLLVLQYMYNNGHAEPLILCSFPTVMDLESKKFVFDLNADYTRVEACERKFLDMFQKFGSIRPLHQDLLFLDVRRASVLEDTFKQLAAVHHSHYKFPLVVDWGENLTFDDIPLYMKDFFYEVFHEMVSAESGMFMFNDSKTLAWFPSKPTQEDQRYFQFGVLCGLALYNKCIIHLPFPLALFKKLLGAKPSLSDMIEFSPTVGEKEFVDAYVNHAFNASVEGVFQEFKQGFFQVCDQDLVKLFRPKELQEVLVGKDFHDWAKLKQNTGYEGEFNTTPPHPTIQMFWEVFDELTEDQRKAFLWFVTGFDRVPVLGMEKIKMTIKVSPAQDLSYDQQYPETHTCFSVLELPLYSTKEIMKTMLTKALSKNRRICK